jgi:hypothetical protein
MYPFFSPEFRASLRAAMSQIHNVYANSWWAVLPVHNSTKLMPLHLEKPTLGNARKN